MKFDTSFWMMVAFIAGLVLSAWKLYMFVPSKQLKDDDTTKESQNELLALILKLIKESDGELNEKLKYITTPKKHQLSYYYH